MTALQFAARGARAAADAVVVGITTQREPRASVARRLMDPERSEREDPAWAAVLAARHDPGQGAGAWRRLLPAIAARRRDPAAADAARPPRIDAPTLVVCGDRDPFVPGRPRLASSRGSCRDGRLFVAPDCGHEVMRTRQRGAGPSSTTAARAELLSFDRAGRLAGAPSRRSQPEDDPMTTLLALYRRPEGGADALATFERRYAAEHLPLVAATPGLRATRSSA